MELVLNLPPGGQSAIAKRLGKSRQWAHKVMRGEIKSAEFIALAEAITARQAAMLRVAQFRHYINQLSDEELLTFFP